jgi:hypothetical protein
MGMVSICPKRTQMRGLHKVIRALHFIAWLKDHTEYIATAEVLAEYIAKTAVLSQMPKEVADKYEKMLKAMGIDLGKVNNEALAKSAMEVALPAMKSAFSGSGKHDNDTSALTALVDAMSIAQDIMHRVHDVATTSPSAIKPESHKEMAQFIWSNKNVSAEEFEKAAISAYGRTAHWLAMAVPRIDVQGGAKTIGEQLEKAYAECNEWAKHKVNKTKCHPEVAAIVHDKVLDSSLGLHALAPSPTQTQQCDRSPSQETKTLGARADGLH